MSNGHSNNPSGVRRGAIGVLRQDGRYFMVKRAATVPKGGLWCFPGGHIEAGETSRTAVIRELHEELGLVVRPVRRLGSLRILDSRHVLAVWIVHQEGGQLRLSSAEIADARWLTPEEIRTSPLSIASNEHVLRMLGD